MFNSFGSKVTLIVSRQQVLPNKDPEVAAVLEQSFLDRGVRLFMGARAERIDVDDGTVSVLCDDGRSRRRLPCPAGHRFPAQQRQTSGSRRPGSRPSGATSRSTTTSRSNVPHIYAAGDLSGKLPLSSVASMQGRKIAEHAMGLHAGPHRHIDYDKAASAIFTDPEIADVGVAEADAFAEGRKIRVTKVPFSVSAKALINNDSPGLRQDRFRSGHRRGARRARSSVATPPN